MPAVDPYQGSVVQELWGLGVSGAVRVRVSLGCRGCREHVGVTLFCREHTKRPVVIVPVTAAVDVLLVLALLLMEF